MIFEGSEKKVEIHVDSSSTGLLRSFDRSFWDTLVEKSQAKILSSISTESMDAYLLSESSLFVWDDRITMITCGRTQLVSAIEHFVQEVQLDNILALIFERKNEYFPKLQESDFYQDIQRLKEIIPGRAYRMGDASEHHLFLFHLEREYHPSVHDNTVELLMYDLHGPARDIFRSTKESVASIRETTGVHQLFDGFKVDDFLFEPFGYSLNAIKDQFYYTIHVTPQELGSYVSFETNVPFCEQSGGVSPQSTVEKVLKVFRPGNFDLVMFHADKVPDLIFPDMVERARVPLKLNCGYEVSFRSFFSPESSSQPAFEIVES